MNTKIVILIITQVLAIAAILMWGTSCKSNNALPSPWYPATNAKGESVLAVYESRIPCPDCERLKFALVLYGNAKTNTPLSYMMARVYVGKNNDRLTNSGEIRQQKGTSLDSTHTVYVLSSDAPAEYQRFWKINDNLLFLLDNNLSPKVGDAGQGYVLNRIH